MCGNCGRARLSADFACRFLYFLKGPPSPEALTAVRAVLQVLALMAVAFASSGSIWGDSSRSTDSRKTAAKACASCKAYA